MTRKSASRLVLLFHHIRICQVHSTLLQGKNLLKLLIVDLGFLHRELCKLVLEAVKTFDSKRTKFENIVTSQIVVNSLGPIFFCSMSGSCINPSRSELQNLERFQKKAVKWITGNNGVNYFSQLRLLNILPVHMFLQVNDLLLLAWKLALQQKKIDLTSSNGRKKEVFRLQKTRTEKARSELTFRNCKLANRLENYVEFSRPYGLK